MRTIYCYILLVLGAAVFLLPSCTKDFETINTNPNSVSAATPDALLAAALHGMVTRNQTRAHRLTNELMQVHVTVNNSDEIHRYVIRPAESDYMWNNWYLELTNFRDMYERADFLNQKSFMGIALILDVWVSSLITDMFGDVPYFESNKGKEGIYQPKFDAQKDIYVDLYRKLEEANELLAANQAFTDEQKSKDILYNGDIARWRKFGNSLYLRLLMRASAKADIDAAAKITDIAETNKSNYPMFANNDESAILRFTGVPPFTSGFFNYRAYDFNGENGLSQFFINNLKEWGDPRIEKWASKVSGTYEGIPSGYPVGQVPVRLSFYLADLIHEPLLGNIISYAEVQFLLAEAALKGYISTAPETYYNKGVENAITLWNLSMPADYLTRDEIRWDDAATFDVKLQQIMLQKYYTFFFTDFQMWYEHRRTGYPVLPKGDGLQNGGLMPARFKYPVAVQSLNKVNYEAAAAAMGGDDMNSKVWWNKN